ncbi:MAG TPA: chaperone modulator CbpM [Desulfurivibrionaceae bacterium]|nr:chaperone modulator CbpM [Desulfurivibrionaceae bacterium]
MAKTVEPEAIEQGQGYTLKEVCLRYCLDSDFVIQCVDFGITEVQGGGRTETWVFPLEGVRRMEKAWRLQHDLGLDFTGLAIVLDLLEEIDQLNGRLATLSRRLSEWED